MPEALGKGCGQRVLLHGAEVSGLEWLEEQDGFHQHSVCWMHCCYLPTAQQAMGTLPAPRGPVWEMEVMPRTRAAKGQKEHGRVGKPRIHV